jgi:hypothetical protein
MIRPPVLAALALIFAQGYAFARPVDPCRTKSRQMTLAKNCYSGDMIKAQEGAPQFFATTTGNTPGVNYCFNSAYDYSLAPDEVKKMKKDPTLVSLKGLKGECFSPTGDKEVCAGGFLKTIGLKDTATPLILGVAKGGALYSVTHLAHDPKEIDAHKPKEIEGTPVADTASVTAHMVQDIRKRLASLAAIKLAIMRSGNSSPKKLADASEQFRYCSMAFEGFIISQKLSDPFTPEEKLSLNTLTSYMNNDPNFAENSRAPASSTPVVAKTAVVTKTPATAKVSKRKK